MAIVSTDLVELTQLAIAEAQLVSKNLASLRNFVTVREAGEGERGVPFPVWSDLVVATGITEGNEAAHVAASTSEVVLIPKYNAVRRRTITDLAASNARQSVADFTRMAVQEIEMKINQDIFALFDSFTTNTLGSTGVDISEANIRAAVKKLKQQGAVGDIFLVITPEVEEDLLSLYSLNTSIAPNSIREDMYAGMLPRIYGVQPIVVGSGLTETNDIKCGVFTRDAIGFAEKSGFAPKIEMQRNANLIGFDLVISYTYATDVINEKFGVELLVDGQD